jgi:hypothetical protein
MQRYHHLQRNDCNFKGSDTTCLGCLHPAAKSFETYEVAVSLSRAHQMSILCQPGKNPEHFHKIAAKWNIALPPFNITETPSFSKQYCKLFSDPGILYMHKHWLTIKLVWQAIELQIPT